MKKSILTMFLLFFMATFAKNNKQEVISYEYEEVTCVVTVGSGEGMAVGHGYGATLKEACDMAYEIAITFAY